MHEISHALRCNKIGGLFLNLDFEKTYGCVNWDFPLEFLIWKGFSALVVRYLMQFVSGGMRNQRQR
jgi:hypothetical protein